MSFLLSAQRDSPDYYKSNSWEHYMAYLESHRENFPASAYTIATSPWWYSFEEPRAPHDSRLAKIEMGEVGWNGDEPPLCWLRIHLESAFSGMIVLHYPKVFAYSLQMAAEARPAHGDWRFDEFSSESMPGRFTHTIEWADGPAWIITANDLIHEYRPDPNIPR